MPTPTARQSLSSFFSMKDPECVDGTHDHEFDYQDTVAGWFCARCGALIQKSAPKA